MLGLAQSHKLGLAPNPLARLQFDPTDPECGTNTRRKDLSSQQNSPCQSYPASFWPPKWAPVPGP